MGSLEKMSRYFLNNTYYFITTPTINHHHFFDTPEKKQIILERIKKAQSRFKLSSIEFSIISFHHHFLVYFPIGKTIPRFLQFINGGSAHQLNKLTGNKKPVWDEYNLIVITSDKMLEKVKGYTIGNPLKHKEVRNFEELKDYPFSSYRAVVQKEGEGYAKALVGSIILTDEKKFFESLKVKLQDLTEVSQNRLNSNPL